jgi:hypothetical protein
VPGRRLTFQEREEIAWRHDRKEGVREIAEAIGRDPSTVSRELRRNASAPRRYRAFPAHIQAVARARRDRPRKLVKGSPVRARGGPAAGPGLLPGPGGGPTEAGLPGEVAFESLPGTELGHGRWSVIGPGCRSRVDELFRGHPGRAARRRPARRTTR